MAYSFNRILAIYNGSNGDDTRALYEHLTLRGPAGVVATNLFRACKTSERAKVYRGGNSKGSYRSQSYDTKQWAMKNLCKALTEHATALGLTWGWKRDPKQEVHDQVLYVDLPTGQVSFHGFRDSGPEYAGDWDGIRGMAPMRIARYCEQVAG